MFSFIFLIILLFIILLVYLVLFLSVQLVGMKLSTCFCIVAQGDMK